MRYTVQQLATLAHITVRTLHHYDELGVLKPSFVGKNGYRYYEDAELARLQQILFYRELEFPLTDIARIMNNPNFDVRAALEEQKQMVRKKRSRLDALLKGIDNAIHAMNTNAAQQPEEMYDVFQDDDVKQYQDEVKERWGSSDAYKESMKRVGKMTKGEMEKMKADGKAFLKRLAEAMEKPVNDPDVQKLIAEHHAGIEFFYTCPLPMYRNLGQMYVDDARFTAYYDAARPGLATWLRDAINVFCDRSDTR